MAIPGHSGGHRVPWRTGSAGTGWQRTCAAAAQATSDAAAGTVAARWRICWDVRRCHGRATAYPVTWTKSRVLCRSRTSAPACPTRAKNSGSRTAANDTNRQGDAGLFAPSAGEVSSVEFCFLRRCVLGKRCGLQRRDLERHL